MTAYKYISILLIAAAAISIVGCQPQRKETYQSGEATIYVSESVLPVVEQEARDFQKTYPKAILHLAATTDRDAIVHLLNGETKLAIVARDLNPEEQLVVRQNKIQVAKIRFAIDGIAVIGNQSNPVDSLTTQQIAEMLRGRRSRWSDIRQGLSGNIVHAMTGTNTSVYEILTGKLINGQQTNCPVIPCSTSTQVIDYVAGHPTAVGYVGINWLTGSGRNNVKILRIGDATVSYDSISYSKTLLPQQFYLWKRVYPLTRDVFALSTDTNAGLPAGFTVYLMSGPGQRTILDAGMVPGNERMPIKLVSAGGP